MSPGPPPLKRQKTTRDGKGQGKASLNPPLDEVIHVSSGSEDEVSRLLTQGSSLDWSQERTRLVVNGKYQREHPLPGHTIVSNSVTFVLQVRSSPLQHKVFYRKPDLNLTGSEMPGMRFEWLRLLHAGSLPRSLLLEVQG